MNDIPRKYPPLFILAWLALLTGMAGAGSALLFQPPAPMLKPLLLMSLGFIAFGAGEILNHPIERIPAAEQTASGYGLRTHRPRNDCSLGNLLDIGALLLIFSGIARFFCPL